jgi:radical SAM superfamily enzyme YgiQ (UPF0313 family)
MTTNSKTTLYLADLTYTQQGLQSETMPHAIGCLAAYATKVLDEPLDIRLFKRPESLAQALSSATPEIIGLSSYVWNFDISYQFARAIKEKHPETIVIFGGPNYPTIEADQAAFLKRHPAIDFYLTKEAEVPFASLVKELIASSFDLSKRYDIPSVHYIDTKTQEVFLPAPAERIRDLSDIPSPYLDGLMDEFFDDGFMPIIQTKRGCPFSCAFCVEGIGYYSKINSNTTAKITGELNYIGQRMAPLVAKGKRADLFIADSNFAMFAEDLDTCRAIRVCQDQYDWPQYVSVATGKNRKERVLEASTILRGALILSGSVQSLDPGVLENIKRKNVSVDQIIDLAIEGGKTGANTVTEVILGLPGDSLNSFKATISRLLEMGFNRVTIYTLMLLPGSELDERAVREKFGFQTRFRVVPKCFGYFDYDGSTLCGGEIEEVVVATDTLSFDDYVTCRIFSLLVETFFSDGFFDLPQKLLKSLGVPLFDPLKRLYAMDFAPRLSEIIESFVNETKDELWSERDDLEAFLREPENIDRFITGEYGNNVLYKHKSLVLVQALVEAGHAMAQATKESIEAKLGLLNDDQNRFISEMVDFCTSCGRNMLVDYTKDWTCSIHYDFERVIAEKSFMKLGSDVFATDAKEIAFILNDEQKKTIARLIGVYGDDVSGLTRLVTRANLKSLLRQPQAL